MFWGGLHQTNKRVFTSSKTEVAGKSICAALQYLSFVLCYI